tara:strand:+ start:961 stop:1263 length:303 start_codon:yes stop_codon:yes gene_type:complete
MNSKETRLEIIKAGHEAVKELIKVAKEPILNKKASDERSAEAIDLAADKLKNAAATKKLAIFDAFEILSRIDSEQEAIDVLNNGANRTSTTQGFAERRSS